MKFLPVASSSRIFLGASALLCLLISANPALGQGASSSTWTGALNNDWFTSGNWNGTVPGTDHLVKVPNGTPQVLINNGTALAYTAIIEGAVVVDGGGSVLDYGLDLIVENSLLIDNGGVVTNSGRRGGFFIGDNAQSSLHASVVVTRGASVISQNGYLEVGALSAGALFIADAGRVLVDRTYVGKDRGNILIEGAHALLESSSELIVGNGYVTMRDGGLLKAGYLSMAAYVTENASLNIRGTPGSRGQLQTAYIQKGPGTVTVSFDGGQLTTTADGDLFRGFSGYEVMVDEAGAYINTQNFNNSITMNLWGSGGLTKLGAGTLEMSGENAYGGLTQVSEGALINNGSIGGSVNVASGATYGGSGNIGGDLTVDGNLSPGNSPGVVNIGGNLVLGPGSGTLIEIAGLAPGQFDQINVAGNVTLNGTLVLQILPGGSLQPGSTINFLTVGGSITGQFSDVVTNLNGTVVPTLVYVGGIPQIVLAQGSFLPFAVTPNQQAVAYGLDSISTTGQNAALIDLLNNLPGTSLASAYDQISPDEYGAMSRSVLSYNSAQQSNMQRRVADLRAGSTGFSANGFTLLGFDRSLLLAGGGDTMVQKILSDPDKSPMRLAPDNRWGFFVNGTGQFGDLQTDGNGQGYDFTTGGVNLGMDYRLTDSLVLGASLGYANSSVQTDGSGGSVKANNAKALLYASWFKKGFYVNGAVGGGGTAYDTSRNVLGTKANGSTSGGDFTTFLGGGYDFKLGGLTIGPATSLEYSYVNVGDFTESGGLAPLQIQDQNFNSLRSRLGVLASYPFEVGDIRIIPTINAAWQHEFMNMSQSISAQFANGAGAVFGVQSADVPRDSAVVGLGVNVEWSRSWSTYLSYDAEATDRFLVNSVNGGVKYRF